MGCERTPEESRLGGSPFHAGRYKERDLDMKAMRAGALIGCLFLLLTVSGAEADSSAFSALSGGFGKAAKPGEMAIVLQILALMTVLSLAPGFLIMTTSFTRIVVVLSFIRNA